MQRCLAISLGLGACQDVFLGSHPLASQSRSIGDMPAKQTDGQMQAFIKKSAEAKVASEAATPLVLEFFDSSEFRAALKTCCSGVADMPSLTLLEALRAEVRASELAHHADGSTKDMSCEIGLEYDWFLNIDQTELIKQQVTTDDEPLAGWSIEDNEEIIFGCPPYANRLQKTWDEAASRLVYIAHNMRLGDVGSPMFGTASAIFSTEYAKDMVLISPTDTGRYSMECPLTSGGNALTSGGNAGSGGLGFNCTAWNPLTVGTLDYNDHLLLPMFDIWAESDQNSRVDQALEFFARTVFADGTYDDLPAFAGQGIKKYYEANILGNPQYPDGIRFLVAVFGDHFGAASGLKLQEWADKWNWPLVWALGDVNGGGGGHRRRKATAESTSFPGNQRILDPSLKRSAEVNATYPSGASDAFASLWETVSQARAAGTPSAAHKTNWWTELKSSQVRLAPASARGCANPDECVGINVDTNECVC